jgi:hypothetical protein
MQSIFTSIQAYTTSSQLPFHRFQSWDNCYKYFSANKQNEFHSLNLGFYLASWGMYRGSSGLLQLNHQVHNKAVDIVLNSAFNVLHCNKTNEVSKTDIINILEIKKQLVGYYSKIEFSKSEGVINKVTATDTLISKILLGTLACVAAYDRYFIDGLRICGIPNKKFDANGLNCLFDFIEHNESEILEAQQYVQKEPHIHYPFMKIVDIYFWHLGFDESNKKQGLIVANATLSPS